MFSLSVLVNPPMLEAGLGVCGPLGPFRAGTANETVASFTKDQVIMMLQGRRERG
jgi:hypothetical protein